MWGCCRALVAEVARTTTMWRVLGVLRVLLMRLLVLLLLLHAPTLLIKTSHEKCLHQLLRSQHLLTCAGQFEHPFG